MNRTLRLRRETLTELTRTELGAVAGGITQNCNTIHFCNIPTLDACPIPTLPLEPCLGTIQTR